MFGTTSMLVALMALAATDPSSPQDEFWQALQALCGAAHEGDGEWRHHLALDLSREVELPPTPVGPRGAPVGAALMGRSGSMVGPDPRGMDGRSKPSIDGACG